MTEWGWISTEMLGPCSIGKSFSGDMRVKNSEILNTKSQIPLLRNPAERGILEGGQILIRNIEMVLHLELSAWRLFGI